MSDELGELDRQVAEALGWEVDNSGLVYRMEQDPGVGVGGRWWLDTNPTSESHWYISREEFSPTTDARQWAVLLEMLPWAVLRHGNMDRSDAWDCTCNGPQLPAWYEGHTPGEAVCRAFLAWKGIK